VAIWLIRADSHGEYKQRFLQEGWVYVTWDDLDVDLEKLADRAQLEAAMGSRNPDIKPKAIRNCVSQVWPFAHEIKKGDLVVLPLKTQSAIQIGEVTGGYHFEPKGPDRCMASPEPRPPSGRWSSDEEQCENNVENRHVAISCR
jgi:restriction system protein